MWTRRDVMGSHVVLTSYALHQGKPLLSGLMLDNGLALLAAYLLRDGREATVFDYNSLDAVRRVKRAGEGGFLDEVVDELSEFSLREHVDVIGFKLYANGFKQSLRIADGVRKRNPNVRLFAGGPQVGWFGGLIFDYARDLFGHDVFDGLVEGEGDAAILALAEGKRNEDVPGAWVRAKSGEVMRNPRREVSLDGVPFPCYDARVYRGVDEKIRIPVVEDSRNCDYRKCAFCIHPRIGGRFRERSIASLLAEVEFNEQKYGLTVFRLGGPDPSPRYVTELARALGKDAKFSAFGRADGEGYDVGLLREKMIGGLFIGLESADPGILVALNKTRDPAGYVANGERLIESFRDAGLATVCSLILPSANETDESIARTLDFVERARPDFTPLLPLLPMPRTPSRKWAEAEGVRYAPQFERKLLEYELDLHLPKEEWQSPPWSLRVRGEFVENPFLVSAEVAGALGRKGFSSLSDEVVLMADCYLGGLSRKQDARRQECHEFHALARGAIERGDDALLSAIVSKINSNI